MKFYNIFIFIQIVVLGLISCQQKKKRYSNEDLQGRWAIDMRSENLSLNRVILDSPHNVYPPRYFLEKVINGFYFFGDSCIYKPGFFDMKNKDNGLPMLIDSKTTFRIDGDTLKIWDVLKLQWRRMLIADLNKDSLMLQTIDNIDRLFKFKKVDRISNNFESYDRIVVVVITPDYLSDEMYYLDKEGNYLYQKFNIRESKESTLPLYQFKLENTQLQSIIDGFDYVDVDSLREEYLSSKSGDNTTYFVFFINNKEIVKTITDDDNVSPDELQWGYMPLIFLRRQLDMKIVELEKDCYRCKEFKGLEPQIFKEVKKRLGWSWDHIGSQKKKD